MKRVYIFILLLYSVSCYAQHIRKDRIESDGRHQILTSVMNISFGRNKYGRDKYRVSMKIFEDVHGINWYLLISSFDSLSSSTVVRLNLGNEEPLTFPCIKTTVSKVICQDYIRFNSTTTITKYNDYNFYASRFALCCEDLDKIEKYGIKKICISNGRVCKEKGFSKNKLGTFLTKCRRCIQKRLEHPLSEFDITDRRTKSY